MLLKSWEEKNIGEKLKSVELLRIFEQYVFATEKNWILLAIYYSVGTMIKIFVKLKVILTQINLKAREHGV